MKENKEIEMNPDDLKLLIEQNEYLKYWLKTLNGIPMLTEDEGIDFMELWNNISLEKKIDFEEPKPEAAAFYFNLFSTGLDNFGLGAFARMAETDPGALGYGIACLIKILSDNSRDIEETQD